MNALLILMWLFRRSFLQDGGLESRCGIRTHKALRAGVRRKSFRCRAMSAYSPKRHSSIQNESCARSPSSLPRLKSHDVRSPRKHYAQTRGQSFVDFREHLTECAGAHSEAQNGDPSAKSGRFCGWSGLCVRIGGFSCGSFVSADDWLK